MHESVLFIMVLYASFSRARSTIHTEPDEGSVSISMLNRHIHSLRKRIRHFEQRFEQEKHYKVREEFKAAWSAGIFCRDWIGSYCLRVWSSVASNHLSQSHGKDFSFFLYVHVWRGVNLLFLCSKMMKSSRYIMQETLSVTDVSLLLFFSRLTMIRRHIQRWPDWWWSSLRVASSLKVSYITINTYSNTWINDCSGGRCIQIALIKVQIQH